MIATLGAVIILALVAYVLYPVARGGFGGLTGRTPAPPVSRPLVTDDEVEAAIRRHRQDRRTCDRCGPRPEPDAVYCSTCGARLA